MNIELNWLHGRPESHGIIKSVPSDFYVSEQLGYPLDGVGEHLFVRVRKEGHNTIYLAEQLAKFAKIPLHSVSYAGLKDRHAITEQWFGLHLAGKADPNWRDFTLENCQIITTHRHRRKLKIGQLKSNQFHIVLRQITQPEGVETRLKSVAKQGVPNYFGEQRFGREGQNLLQAERWAKGEIHVKNRQRRRFYLSAIRSMLFNRIVSCRLADGLINQILVGDVMQLCGSHSWFIAQSEALLSLTERLQQHDIVITAPLPGEGALATKEVALAFEEQQLIPYAFLLSLLQQQGVATMRRAMVVIPEALSWQWLSESDLKLIFTLPSGSFATSVIRELIHLQENSPNEKPL